MPSTNRARGSRPLQLGTTAVLAAALAAGTGLPATATVAPGQDYLFDFQCAGNPTAPGFTAVTPSSVYSAGGHGFVAPAAIGCRDRGGAGDLALRDFLLPTSGTPFRATVANGTYTVVLRSGDLIASSNTGFTVEGRTVAARGAGSGVIDERVVDGVEVTDGVLDVGFSGSSIRLNSIEVLRPIAAPQAATPSVVATADSASVTLAWPAVDGVAGYRVFRSADGGPAAPVADVPAGAAPSWTDTDVQLADTYAYSVASLGPTGRESARTDAGAVTVVDPEQEAPATPTGVAAAWGEDGLAVSWTRVPGAVAYDVYRARPGREPVQVARTTEAAWTDVDAQRSAHYVYQVAAVSAGGRSDRSALAEVEAAVQHLRQAERLDRAPVAVAVEGGVYVGWRLLADDPQDLAFHVYRNGKRITSKPVTGATNVVDSRPGDSLETYRIATVVDGIERWASEGVTARAQQTLDVPLHKPADGTNPDGSTYTYNANDASVGDLDGDGQYEIVVKWDPSNSQDNSRAGYTGNVYVDAYRLDGTRLWRIDLGRNIRAGAHYTQFQVFDYDGDGRAEVAMKTADGTVDGAGTVLGDAAADHRNSAGYVLSGPELLTVFSGQTGAALDTVDYTPPRGTVGSWGDGYGNRVDRFLAGTAYLDGERPSLLVSRGYYTRTVVAAYDFDGTDLTRRWVFDSNEAGKQYEGQGNHSLSVADVDGDQKDEVVFGSMTLDDDGTVLYNTGLGHGDAQHVSDFDPTRVGLEVFSAHESMGASGNRGATYRDAETGEVLWSIPATRDTGRAAMADVDPRHAGAEGWAVGGDAAWNSPVGQMRSASGDLLSETIPAANFLTWWDGDLLREIGDHAYDPAAGAGVPTIAKWDWEAKRSVEIYRATGTLTSNSTKGNPALQADLLGDWREEIVTRTADSTALRIATTVDVTEHRLRTLMSDPVYRLGVAWQNTGYNQPPHTSYFLGEGMTTPPAPAVALTGTDPGPGERVAGARAAGSGAAAPERPARNS